jgi:hypothetical protein
MGCPHALRENEKPRRFERRGFLISKRTNYAFSVSVLVKNIACATAERT